LRGGVVGAEGCGMKRIRMTVEWDGAASEDVWANVLREEIEDADVSGTTCVTEIEHLTNEGTTEVRDIAQWIVDRNIARQYRRRRIASAGERDYFWPLMTVALAVMVLVHVVSKGG
jgi:hypothetical protein